MTAKCAPRAQANGDKETDTQAHTQNVCARLTSINQWTNGFEHVLKLNLAA